MSVLFVFVRAHPRRVRAFFCFGMFVSSAAATHEYFKHKLFHRFVKLTGTARGKLRQYVKDQDEGK